jgi:hypothetical protein
MRVLILRESAGADDGEGDEGMSGESPKFRVNGFHFLSPLQFFLS